MRIFFFLLFLLLAGVGMLRAQSASPPAGATAAPVCGPDQISYVALNVHFVQDYLGGGNFRELDDTTTHHRDENGYHWAQSLVWAMNWPHGWTENPPMALFKGEAPPPQRPKNVQFVLTGVYFDRLPAGVDTTRQYYYFVERTGRFYTNASDPWLYDRYGQQKGQAINVLVLTNGFFYYTDWQRHTRHHPRFDGGVMVRPDCVKLVSPWAKAQGGGAGGYGTGGPWEFANILSHEIGHAFGLAHTWEGNDGCDDTPSRQDTPPNFNCWAADSKACAERGMPASNNMMDYNSCQCALTPCQLDRIHQALNTRLHGLVRGCGPCAPVSAFFAVPERVGRRPRHVYLDASASFNEDHWRLDVLPVAAVGATDSLPGQVGYHRGGTRSLDEEAGTPYGPGTLDLAAGFRFRPRRTYLVRLRVWRGCDPAAAAEYVRYVRK